MITYISTLDNKITEIAQDYFKDGYRINTETMRGSDGTNRIDLIKGKHFVRVFYQRVTEYSFEKEHPNVLPKNFYGDVIVLTVGSTTVQDVRTDLVWSDKLDIITEKWYYTIGERYRREGITSDIEEVQHACDIHDKRWKMYGSKWDRMQNRVKKYNTLPYLQIGLRAVKQLPKTKSIHLEHIKYVAKDDNGNWTVDYITPSGKEYNCHIRP